MENPDLFSISNRLFCSLQQQKYKSVVISKVNSCSICGVSHCRYTDFVTDSVLSNVFHSDVPQPGGNVGEETCGPERHPRE